MRSTRAAAPSRPCVPLAAARPPASGSRIDGTRETMTTPYPTLLSPIRIGKHIIRNRVWMAAHATLLVKDNLFTEAHLHYYAERARHGVGIIT
ncbi:MAG: hypothetical protein FJX57_19345, partial [Alphaproteobacteria bacterium]|nr:hypothetical protein [Alphaproteobacteria bacterium]